MRATILALGLLAAACTAPSSENQADPDAAVSSATAPTQSPAADRPAPAATPVSTATGTQVASLAGEWRVAGIDGGEFNESYGLALSADASRIWWEPECAGQQRLYSIDGLGFEATERDTGDRAVCEIGWPERLPEVWRAIDAADRIERTESNGVLLSGGGHSVLLFSQ